jgi:hypothetical protein
MSISQFESLPDEPSSLSTAITLGLNAFIKSEKTCEDYRESKKFFTRKSPISFINLVYLLLSNMSNSLSVELFNILTTNNLQTFTKAAFSERRYQLKPTIFVKLHELFTQLFYEKGKDSLVYWHGFILNAIDGSTLVLPNTPDIKGTFGTHKNGRKGSKTLHETVMGRLMVQYDVLNHVITNAEVHPIAKGERTLVYPWISTFLSNSLTLFDRGFASFTLFYLMQKHNKHFVARLALNFNNTVKAFVASGHKDQIVTFCNSKKQVFGDCIIPKNTQVQIRLVQVLLPNGTVEVLATSLLDSLAFPTALFAQLYSLRWGVETCFDRLKNKLLVLCFTGHKANAIYQEIYASIVIHNLQQVLASEAQSIVNQKIIEKKAQGKIYKYDQKINDNVTIGILKPRILSLFMDENTKTAVQFLIQNFAQYTEPIRPNRTNLRKKSLAKKRNLYTQTNFRRAG